jgi:hypothetical protein
MEHQLWKEIVALLRLVGKSKHAWRLKFAVTRRASLTRRVPSYL